ncbi:probable polyamine oxidase 4 [Xenia sp. Carnegie-2017]|uniref:probable polyamine oxidase 4 n=1 Tax=Xenia sp. Carnegie-2017 TaxID=2897299 RepID=UPI001F035BB3|nr:probable polyamine oxidase 4 [Xenia sp. Carnegie-2017]
MASQYLLSHKRFWENDEPIKLPGNNSIPIQHNDCIKTFLKCIQDEGLQKAYNSYGYKDQESSHSTSVVSAVQEDETMVDVIVVGAGMAGLSAAYELKKAGLSLKILEQTERYGGRVYTYGKESGLASGLYAEAGAMRLPGESDEQSKRQHYLTDGYIKNFNLSIKRFPNYDKNVVSSIYGYREKTEVWCEKHFIKTWPNWKDGINEELKGDITDIYKYYKETTDVVTDQLYNWLSNSKSVVDQVNAWVRWIKIWSQFTVESFLESNINVIKAKVSVKDQKDLDAIKLENLLPWSNDAVRGLSVFCYVSDLEQSLVHFPSFKLGKWASGEMHCLKGGMHNLPKAIQETSV